MGGKNQGRTRANSTRGGLELQAVPALRACAAFQGCDLLSLLSRYIYCICSASSGIISWLYASDVLDSMRHAAMMMILVEQSRAAGGKACVA